MIMSRISSCTLKIWNPPSKPMWQLQLIFITFYRISIQQYSRRNNSRLVALTAACRFRSNNDWLIDFYQLWTIQWSIISFSTIRFKFFWPYLRAKYFTIKNRINQLQNRLWRPINIVIKDKLFSFNETKNWSFVDTRPRCYTTATVRF